MFKLSENPLDLDALRSSMSNPKSGACVTFEGWVRNHNEGRPVLRLEYEAYQALALKVGNRILSQAVELFPIEDASCVHRIGRLEIGQAAVWVGVTAAHRGDAFLACRYIIDEIKLQVPIWKRELYSESEAEWII